MRSRNLKLPAHALWFRCRCYEGCPSAAELDGCGYEDFYLNLAPRLDSNENARPLRYGRMLIVRRPAWAIFQRGGFDETTGGGGARWPDGGVSRDERRNGTTFRAPIDKPFSSLFIYLNESFTIKLNKEVLLCCPKSASLLRNMRGSLQVEASPHALRVLRRHCYWRGTR